MWLLNKLTKLIRASSLALIVYLLQAASCDKDEPFEVVEVRPRMHLTISPPGQTIYLGDTLWVNIDIPDTVEDYLSKKYYKIKGFDFFTSIMLLRLIGPAVDQGQQPSAASSFTFYPVVGEVYSISSLSGRLKFDYSRSRYRAKVGLITKQRGVFCLIMLYRGDDTSGRSYGEAYLDIEGAPTNGMKTFYRVQHINYIINHGNFHFDLYEANCLVPPQLKSDPMFIEEGFNTYTFEVK
jgi:hypothetical protein